LEDFGMDGLVRGQYTLEFKREAVRLARGGEAISSVAKTLGISGQSLHNWVKAEAAGKLREVTGKSISAEQMEIACLKAELIKTRMERDILKKAAAYFARESR
jgi:transposase-like protein